jgi:cytochrome c peroxidase
MATRSMLVRPATLAGLFFLASPVFLASPALAQVGGGGGGNPDPPPPPLIGRFPNVAVPADNPQTPQKILLGMALFFEEQLSSDDTVACATCHLPEAGGGDPRAGARAEGFDHVMNTPDDEFGSPGVVGQDRRGSFVEDPLYGFVTRVTQRNSPSAIGAAFFNTQFWDQRVGPVFKDLAGNVVLSRDAALEAQAVEPPLSATEMSHPSRTWSEITAKLARVRPLQLATDLPARLEQFLAGHATYGPLFAQVFGSPVITRERVAMAIASYERTLVADQTPFDLGTLSAHQQQGFFAFQHNGLCESCHASNNKIFSVGSMQDIALPDHERAVKIPSLRNVGLRRRFMSSGQFATLDEVLAHYESQAIFTPGPGDHDALVDFLANGLTDPRVANRLPPFDRPTLHSELAPSGANLTGVATAGGGGVEPVMLADCPPFVGNASFRIGVGHAAGRAKAVLLLGPAPAAPGATFHGVPLGVELASATASVSITSRAGAGHGLATYASALPKDVALVGRAFWAQWLIQDPAAPLGLSASRTARFELFARQ